MTNRFSSVQQTVSNITTSTLLLAANPSRRYLLIQNRGAEAAYICFGKEADYSGVRLSPQASSTDSQPNYLKMDCESGIDVQAVYARNSGGASAITLNILEG